MTTNISRYFFDPIVVKIQEDEDVWTLTPHGQALGNGMAKSPHIFAGKSIVEIGTGCGAHAIAAVKLGAQYIDVTDINKSILEVAAQNAERNGVSFRHAVHHDWMNFEPIQKYDTLLCNPPFCKSGMSDRRFFIKKMIAEASRFIKFGGHLIFCQSSMANFTQTELELKAAGFIYTNPYISRGIFRDYYFTEPNFIEESREVPNGFDEIDGVYIETLKVFLCTLSG